MLTDEIIKRRTLLKLGGAGTGLLISAVASAQPRLPGPSSIDVGRVNNGKVEFPAWRGEADKPEQAPPAPMPPEQRIGFAIVGLGRLTLEEILPAFAQCKNAKVTALVSGTPDKLQAVARQHGISPSACYDYAGFDRIKDNANVQAVYIVLPNALHRSYTERAAAAGKHVLCEKPLSTSSADARVMIAACERAGVHLMAAYRIHYEPYNLRARRFVQDKTFGRLVTMSATNVQTNSPMASQQWRLKKALAGGGALPDVGIYCLNTARFISGEEPVEVMAWQHSPQDDPRFTEVEATVSFMLRFPSGLVANCHCSYDAREDKHQRLQFAQATLDMPRAYEYEGQRMVIGEREDNNTGNTELQLTQKNQFAEEIDHMAECIQSNQKPRTPGEEGLQDHILIEAIYRSAATGLPVRLQA